MPRPKLKEAFGPTIPLRVPEPLQKQVRAGVKQTGLSQQDLMRKSIEIGLPRLLNALEQAVSMPAQAA